MKKETQPGERGTERKGGWKRLAGQAKRKVKRER